MFKSRFILIAVSIIASAAIFTAVTGFASIACAPDKNQQMKARISAETKVEQISTLTDHESEAVALAASRVLHHVDSARRAIADGKTDNALRQIEKGLNLVQIIENSVPKHKVTTDIQSGNLSYHDEEDISQRFVAIYDEQHVESIIAPVVQAKSKAGDGNASKEKTVTGNEEPLANASTTAPIEDVSMYQHTAMKLDVVLAERMLERAKKKINQDEADLADEELCALQTDGVTFSTYSIELPLAEASDNLILAQVQARDGLHDEALATLKLASKDLKKYELLTGESRAKEVRKLHQEIDELTKSLDHGKSITAWTKETEKRIATWWDRVAKWFKK